MATRRSSYPPARAESVTVRLLFDILHPAHVHFFRPLAQQVQRDGGQVLFCARDKDVTMQLLAAYGLPHRVLSSIGAGAVGLACELAQRTARLVAICREQRPDVLLGSCGDGECLGLEDGANCAADCVTGCGDGTCSKNESILSCSQDCAFDCGDGVCTVGEDCDQDCNFNCGDGNGSER